MKKAKHPFQQLMEQELESVSTEALAQWFCTIRDAVWLDRRVLKSVKEQNPVVHYHMKEKLRTADKLMASFYTVLRERQDFDEEMLIPSVFK